MTKIMNSHDSYIIKKMKICITSEPLRIEIDLMTYKIEFWLFIILDREVYLD